MAGILDGIVLAEVVVDDVSEISSSAIHMADLGKRKQSQPSILQFCKKPRDC